MNSIFTFADDNTDFTLLKKRGMRGVLIKATSKISENIKKAAACEMNILVQMSAETEETVERLTACAGRISFENGNIKYVSIKDLKRTISEIGSAIGEVSGFMLPLPRTHGPMWCEELENMCNFGVDSSEILYDLFDEEKERSSARSWYYTNLERYIVSKYMEPQKMFLENLGLNVIFNTGTGNMQPDLQNSMVSIVMLKREGFQIAKESLNGGNEPELENGDFLLTDEGCVRIEHMVKTGKILLVKPARGVMERYIQGRKINRMETPALVAETEGVYYSDMLIRKGYCFDVADEFSFASEENFKKYEQILICSSCLFSEIEIKRIEELKKDGMSINDRELICDMALKGEE